MAILGVMLFMCFILGGYAYFKLHKSHKQLNKENKDLKTERLSEEKEDHDADRRPSAQSSGAPYSYSTSSRTSARDMAYMQGSNNFGRELDMHELYGGDDEVRMSSSLSAHNPLHSPSPPASGRPTVPRQPNSASFERESIGMRGSISSAVAGGRPSRASYNGRSQSRQAQLRELQSPRDSQRAPAWAQR